MSRRHAAEKREVLPDAKFGDRVLTKFMNNLMIDGKKSVAERIVYNALDRVEDKPEARAGRGVPRGARQHQAVGRGPLAPGRWCHLPGARRSAPRAPRGAGDPLADQRRRARNENTMEERLAGELVDAVNSRGSAVKKREDTHKMADANKAFSHYRW
jgi:small subunit ribosomal protein S7